MASFLFGIKNWFNMMTRWAVELKRVTVVLIFVKNALIFWLFDLTLL